MKDTRNWDLSKFVDVNFEIHNIAYHLKAYGYSSLDERSKFRHLLRGTKHPMMEYPNTLITYKPPSAKVLIDPLR